MIRPSTRTLPFRNYIPAPELAAYRKYTTALLHRYFRMSMAVGRLPNLLGREFFRAKLTRPRTSGFEDATIFVIDVERCLARLEHFPQQLIARCVLQEYTIEDAAPLIGCGERSIYRHLPDALDQLSEIFLSVDLLPKSLSRVKSSESEDSDSAKDPLPKGAPKVAQHEAPQSGTECWDDDPPDPSSPVGTAEGCNIKCNAA